MSTAAVSRGEARVAGAALVLLLPPTLYALGSAPLGYGPPYMLLQLMGPGSDHSAVGLLLLLIGRFLCPLTVLALSLGFWRRRRLPRLATFLLLASLLLLALALATRQPYGIVHPSRALPDEVHTSESKVLWREAPRPLAPPAAG